MFFLLNSKVWSIFQLFHKNWEEIFIPKEIKQDQSKEGINQLIPEQQHKVWLWETDLVLKLITTYHNLPKKDEMMWTN